MLCLRVALGSSTTTLLRRLLLTVLSGGAAFLLLCVLGDALAHPERAEAASVRLLWCVAPAAAAVHLSVAVSRAEPSNGLAAGLAAAGGSRKLPLLAATATGISCGLGSVLGLVAFLNLRAELMEPPGPAPSLPPAATVTLLALVPLVGAAASAAAMRPRQTEATREAKAREARRDTEEAEEPARTAAPSATLPSGLPWGAALTCMGLAVELYAKRWEENAPGGLLALPGGFGRVSATMLLGWSLTAAGLVMAGPGLVHLCGRLLSCARPGALRLLAGRALQEEAHRIGRPLGVLCAVGSAVLATTRLWHLGPEPRPGPLTLLGAAVLGVFTVSTALSAAVESKAARMPTTQTLHRLGAPASLVRRTAAVRAAALFALLAPVTWLVGQLAALPLNV